LDATSFSTFRCRYRERILTIRHPATLGRDWFRSVLAGLAYPPPPCFADHPRVIVDVGANIGIVTLYFALSNPGARILALEPSSESFHCLQANTAPFPNVTALNVGLCDRDCQAELHRGSNCVTDSVIAHHFSTPRKEVVTLRRASALLSEVLGEGPVSILKVDTEGCEVPILEDLAGWLPRIDCLYYEYHSDEDRIQLDRLLSPHFYVFLARARSVHRGVVGMVAKRLEADHPEMNHPRIVRPEEQPEPG
jgi:FkbM family methyltransferase